MTSLREGVLARSPPYQGEFRGSCLEDWRIFQPPLPINSSQFGIFYAITLG